MLGSFGSFWKYFENILLLKLALDDVVDIAIVLAQETDTIKASLHVFFFISLEYYLLYKDISF